MAAPAPWVNADDTSNNLREQSGGLDAVSVSVSREVLEHHRICKLVINDICQGYIIILTGPKVVILGCGGPIFFYRVGRRVEELNRAKVLKVKHFVLHMRKDVGFPPHSEGSE